MATLLGIDNGLTVTKAVLFDADGTVLAIARRRVPQSRPRPRHVERDMEGLWDAAAEAIREAIERSGRPASDIAGIAATAHGDGLYALDREGRPLGPGILSLDSRAHDVVARWEADDLPARALELTGQAPHASAPSALLAWVQRREPERLARIGHILAAKDWLRYRLTGTIGTDRTEASTSFTNVRTQDYDRDALDLYGLDGLWDALPPVAACDEIIGSVTVKAARETGLVAGTPVMAGLHDVTASALGIGAHRPGTVGIVAGTYSINEVVAAEPRSDPRWFCRNGILPGEWNAMAISPASTANYDWFLDTLASAERERAEAAGTTIHGALAPEIEAALASPTSILFHPYLFGSPYGAGASASFLGLRGWHRRGDMIAAVLEGIAHNHRHHVDALGDGFTFTEARLTGGASRNPLVAQLFADVLGRPVIASATEEAAAWGAALCAGSGVGLFDTPLDDPRDLAATERRHEPDPATRAMRDERHVLHLRAARGLRDLWPDLDALGGKA